MRYRLEVRITAADVGQRVTIRWRPPELDGTKLMTDVLGILEEADGQFFKVRRGRDGQLIAIPCARARRESGATGAAATQTTPRSLIFLTPHGSQTATGRFDTGRACLLNPSD
jgi:hypothetical protein